jgi:transcription antitermination protein NusB
MLVRRIARELALLSMNQLPSQPKALTEKSCEDMILAAVRSLMEEAKEMLLDSGSELRRGNDKLLDSETRLDDPRTTLKSAQETVREAIALAETAVNRAGFALEFPELIQVSKQSEIREYAMELIMTVHKNKSYIDELLTNALVDWQLDRLALMDRQILQLAVAELIYLNVPTQIAISEAVELAKRYSSKDGYRFVNGVLRAIAKKV